MTKENNIPPGFKTSIIGLIPSDWEVNHIEEIADIDKNSLSNSTQEDYKFKYISLSDVDSNDSIIETTDQIFKTAPSRARRIVQKGDVLMATVRPNLQGFTIIKNNAENLIASTGFAVISSLKCNNEFLFHSLFGNAISKQLYQMIVGSNYPGINSSDVRRIKILLPPLPEQTAIAACLSTWDKAINNCQLIIDTCQLRKKWLMQQLLTGKKRLPGFEKTKWHLKSLEEVAEFKNGKAHENVIVESGKFMVVNSKFISTGGNVVKFSNENLCPLFINDITMVMSDIPNGKALAKCFYVSENEKYTLNQRICLIRAFESTDCRFLFYLLNRNIFYLSFDNGVGQTNLKKEEVLECPLLMPEKEEQSAIAQVLQSADKEINLLKTKLDKLKEQKRGLMQVLLTGRKRLSTRI